MKGANRPPKESSKGLNGPLSADGAVATLDHYRERQRGGACLIFPPPPDVWPLRICVRRGWFRSGG